MNADEAKLTPNVLPPLPPRRKRRRLLRILLWVVPIVALMVLGGIARTLLKSRAAGDKQKLKDPIHLEQGEVEERLLETGKVELRTTIEVKSKMSGKVKRLLVEEGDVVEAGQTLAVIEPDPNEILRLYQKRAAVQSRAIEREEKTRDLERACQLHEQGVMPSDQYEKAMDAQSTAETNYRLALLELQALEREMNPGTAYEAPLIDAGSEVDTSSILSALTDITVVSPISGLVIKRPVEVGELVISGTATTIAGTTMMELGDPGDALIRAAVNEVDVGKLQEGQRVEVTLSAYEDEVFPAAVHRISPIGANAEGKSIVSFQVEIRFDKLDPRIMPGMTCDLDIVIARKEDAFCLPNHALFQEREKKEDEGEEEEKRNPFAPPVFEEEDEEEEEYLDYVWVKKGEDYERREVALGLKGDEKAEIIEGLTTEDKVYPDAERMRWIMKERERKAKRQIPWPWRKKPDAEEDEEQETGDNEDEAGDDSESGEEDASAPETEEDTVEETAREPEPSE